MEAAAQHATGALVRLGLEPRGGWVRLAGGELSDVYGVDLADGRSVVVKVYPPQWTWKQDKEIHVYGRMRGVPGVRTPAVLAHDPPSGPDGRAVTVLTRIAGEPLSGVVGSSGPSGLVPVYREMGRTLRALHEALLEPSYGYVVTTTLDPLPDNRSYVLRQFSKKVEELRTLGAAGALADRIDRRLQDAAGVLAGCTRAVLCHNDLHEGNVMVSHAPSGWRMEGVVDVENAVAADPLLDLAKTEYYAVRGDPVRLAGLRDGYGPLDDDAEERVALYRMYHALELYVWFAGQGRTSTLASIRADLESMSA